MTKEQNEEYADELLKLISHLQKMDKIVICQKMLDKSLKDILTHEQEPRREIIQKMSISKVITKPVNRLLDFGCNTGRLTGFLNIFADEIYGADIEEWYGAELVKNCPEAKYIQIKHNKLLVEDGFFDIVFSCKVLQHFENNVLVVMGNEIRRILSDKGKLILYEGFNLNDRHRYDILPLKKLSCEIVNEIDDTYGVFVFEK